MKDQSKHGGASASSLSYQVPALDGRMIQATPLKFCLKYKPPTIAVVYTINSASKKKTRKYIHSIHVDFNQATKTPKRDNKPLHTVESLKEMCEVLCYKESAYLNTTIISKSQVSYSTFALVKIVNIVNLICD